ncbi:phosphoadenylyl-sulfate reductase [Arsenicicoccus bolidensis]|uniref:phosphoadenylyl-sulfate reductase n=1 Tax=Arsenicicoccus bolidensis TaxID=229480 RepID=UPI0028AA9BFE|nr:phosphoadenylyl-sulfate reductase [Arsenicicoccus bolidensis]
MSVTTLRSEQELRELVERDAAHLETLSAHDVVAWAAGEFGESWAVAGSMQDGVLGHLVDQVAPGTRLYFLDTGYHFPETLATRDETVRRMRLDVITLTPAQTVPEQDAEHGVALHDRDPDLCCALRKTHPLDDALGELEAWATGVRRVQSPTRRDTPVIGFDERRLIVKVAPLASWSDQDVAEYAERHDVVRNPLLDQGYPSIGCAPCTRRVAPGEDARAGRWSGTAKIECGIQL